jgi:hypothetical protein
MLGQVVGEVAALVEGAALDQRGLAEQCREKG